MFDADVGVAARLAPVGRRVRQIRNHARRSIIVGCRVRARTAVQPVRSRSAAQNVIAAAAVQPVVATEAPEAVRAAVAPQRVGVPGADKPLNAHIGVAARLAPVGRRVRQVRNHARRRHVVGRRVRARPAVQPVGPRAAAQPVVAAAAVQRVVAAGATEDIVPRPARDFGHIVPSSSSTISKPISSVWPNGQCNILPNLDTMSRGCRATSVRQFLEICIDAKEGESFQKGLERSG